MEIEQARPTVPPMPETPQVVEQKPQKQQETSEPPQEELPEEPEAVAEQKPDQQAEELSPGDIPVLEGGPKPYRKLSRQELENRKEKGCSRNGVSPCNHWRPPKRYNKPV